MKTITYQGIVAVALAALLAAPVTAQDSATPAASPQETTVPPSAQAAPRPTITAAVAAMGQSYICSDGSEAGLLFDDPAGVVIATRLGEVFTLFRQVGQTPPRYVSGSDTLVVGNHEVVVVRGSTGRLRCVHRPNAPLEGAIWGKISTGDSIVLPAGTKVKVMLTDQSRGDAPAVELASTSLVTTGNPTPFAFQLGYDPERISKGSYSLTARINAKDGKLLFMNKQPLAVLADGKAQPPVELQLDRMDEAK